ncbi:MAG: YfcC family protein [Lachnospiraceae bacterium]|nr:YfcC family protein [Lachnospiraceae bacterium]
MKGNRKSLSNYSLLLIIIGIIYLISFLIPSGSFERVDGAVDSDSFTLVDKVFVSPVKLFMELPNTVISQQASTILAMIIVAGAIGVVTRSGALDLAIYSLTKRFESKILIVIPIIFLYFGALSLVGVQVVIPFVPLAITLARRMKLDNIFAASVMILGAYCGFMSSPINPFTTAVAQEIAGLPTFSGAGLRTVLTIILLTVMAAYMCWYAARVRKDPGKSVMEQTDFSEFGELAEYEGQKMELRHWLTLIIFFTGFILFGILAAKNQYGTKQLAAIMLPTAFCCGIVNGWGVDKIMEGFIDGAQRQIVPIVVMILACAVPTIFSLSGILDTVVYYLSMALSGLNSALAAIGMFIANAIINLAIPSGSAQAVAVMPIMAPLSDGIGVSRQTAVLAYQLGDGFTNLLNPACAPLVGCLAAARCTLKDWFKLIIPLYMIVFVICCVFLIIATRIGW